MIVARNLELAWLEKQSRLNRLLFVSGVRGVGKSSLLASWVKQKERRFRWITVDRLRSLTDSLGHPDKPLERTLESVAQEWMNLDVVVWDEAHLIAPAAQKALFSFLKNSPFLPLQIFLSDESLESDASEAQLHLSPFSPDQAREYLSAALEHEPTEEEVATAMKLSGGVPLLLQILSSDGSIRLDAKQQLLENLSPAERSTLVAASALGRTFHTGYFSDDSQRMTLPLLRKKFLLDQIPTAADTYIVPSYIRSLCLAGVDVTELKNVYGALCRRAEDPFEALFFALRAEENDLVKELVEKISFDRVEHLRREDLLDLSSLIRGYSTRSKKTELVNGLARLEIRALWFLGQRSQAVEVAEGFLAKFGDKMSQELVLEIVQIFNRAARTLEARKLAERAISISDAFHVTALRLEIGSSWVYSDRNIAREILNDALRATQRLTVRGERESQLKLIQAQCHFQLARCYDLDNKFDLAVVEYEKALVVFEQCERPYFSAVTMLNCAWIYLKEYRFGELKKLQKNLSSLAERYGYTYVAAGLELIEAIEARLNLEPGKALRKIESSLRRLGKSAPLMARIDSQIELVRVLLTLGMRKQAELAYKKFKTLSKAEPEFQKTRVRDLYFEVNGHNLPQEELLEHIGDAASLDESSTLLFARRGLVRLSNNAGKIRLGKIATLEEALFESLKGNDEQQVWKAMSQIDAMLREISDASLERVSLLLLQATLSKNTSNNEEKILEAERELARLSVDASVAAPLMAWLDSLKGGKGSRPQEMDNWRLAPIGDQERWQRWLGAIFPVEEKPWALISNDSIKYSDKFPQDADVSLLVLEHLGEVKFRGKVKHDFIRRHSLRRILCLLLEGGMDGVAKHTIAAAVWGEDYSPEIHDTRLYTAIQRLRNLFMSPDTIQNWHGGYRWNPEIGFLLIRANQKKTTADTRCQSLILQTLERYSDRAKPWVGRSELVAITKTSEATVKRELSKLLNLDKIRRTGSGRAVVYSLNGSGVSRAG